MEENGASSYHRFPNGKENDISKLVVTYSDPLVRFVYSFVQNSAVAEDVAAESIARLITGRHKFEDEVHMRAYLFKIARNKALDELRKKKREVPLEDLENILGCADPEGNTLRQERNAVLYRCMLNLPSQYRQVLQLAYFEEFSIPQIAIVLRKNVKQVYNLLARAKASLKQLLETEGIFYADI